MRRKTRKGVKEVSIYLSAASVARWTERVISGSKKKRMEFPEVVHVRKGREALGTELRNLRFGGKGSLCI